MPGDLLAKLLSLAALLTLSAYFSGSEAALFSLGKLEQEALRRRPGRRTPWVLERLSLAPDQLLITILTGNMFVNVFASSLGEAIGRVIFPGEAELLSIVVMTVLLLLVGEMAPKNLGVRFAVGFSRSAAGPLFYLYHALRPLRWFLGLFNRVGSALSRRRLRPAGTALGSRVASVRAVAASTGAPPRHGIIRSAVHIGFKEGILDPSELHLVESFCDFQETEAEEVMVPRTEIQGIDLAAPFDPREDGQVLLRKAAGSSLVPAYSQDLDHIVGYLALRDVLPLRFGIGSTSRPADLVRPCLSVPASKDCADLLREMREASTEMAVVIDEYGGTAGIITFKGLVEELLGYFYPVGESALQETAPGEYRAAGNLRIEVLEQLLGAPLDCESRTVAGLIIERLGELPNPGTSLQVHGWEVVVVKITKTRILEVQLRRRPQ